MLEFLGLTKLGERIRAVDRHLVEVIAQRKKLVLQVGEEKRVYKGRIVRAGVEEERLREVQSWAVQKGLNPHFVHALLYLIIDESCKAQTEQLQNQPDPPELVSQSDDEWYEVLKRNLLELTRAVAPTYDQKYDEAYFATHCYLDFEREQLIRLIQELPHRHSVVDLGCATGRIALGFASQFEQAIGFDLSPAMIDQATAKLSQMGLTNVTLSVTDIEEGVPISDGSASLVVMNLGTASDVRAIGEVMVEIRRILRPGGAILLSFYNADALLYRVGFLPWPAGLAAEINLAKHCLDVHIDDHNAPFSIHARPYRVSEVENLFTEGLACEQILTFPTICSVLPPYMFDGEEMRQPMTELDRKVADSNFGAYIIAVARKT